MVPEYFVNNFIELSSKFLLDEFDPDRVKKNLECKKINLLTEKLLKKSVEVKLSSDDRVVIAIHYKWFILLLMKVSNDRKMLISSVTQYLTDMLSDFYTGYYWIFKSSLQMMTSVMKQCLDFDQDTIIITNPVKDVQNQHIKDRLGHLTDQTEMKITSSEDFNHLLKLIVNSISSLIPLYQTNHQELKEICGFAGEILRIKSFPSKITVLLFLSRYIENVTNIESEINLLVSVLRSLSVVTRDLNILCGETELKIEYVAAVGDFFDKISTPDLELTSKSLIAEVITSCRTIITNLQKLALIDSRKSLMNITGFVEKVLDANSFDGDVVRGLEKFEIEDKSNVLNLIKYPVISEIYNSSLRSTNAPEMSSTWDSIHRKLMFHVFELSNGGPIDFIMQCFNSTIQLNMKAHQIHHIYHIQHFPINNDDTCKICHEPFKELRDIQEFQLKFFDDSSHWITNLVDFIKRDTSDLDHNLLTKLSCLMLKFFPNVMNIDRTVRYMLVAILASPFHGILQSHAIMKSLPQNFKNFFTKNHIVKEDLVDMKCESIVCLSQISIHDQDICRLIIDIMHSISMGDEQSEVLRTVLNANMINLLVNNSESLGSLRSRGVVESMFKTLCASPNFPFEEIMCLTAGNVYVLSQTSSSISNYKFTVHCTDCVGPITTSKLIKTKSCLAVFSKKLCKYLENVTNTDLIDLYLANITDKSISSFKSIIMHSETHRNLYLQDCGKQFFNMILIEKVEYLESMASKFQGIIEALMKVSQSTTQSEKILKVCFDHLSLLTSKCVYQDNQQIQSAVLELVRTLINCLETTDETNMIRCFALLLNYIVLNESRVKGQATSIAFEVTRKFKIHFEDIFKLYKTFLLSKVSRMMMHNVRMSSEGCGSNSMVSSFSDLRRRMALLRYEEFLKFCLDIIASTCIPFAVNSTLIDKNLRQLWDQIDVGEIIEQNLIPIYHTIYESSKNRPELREQCRNYLEKEIGTTIRNQINRYNQHVAENVVIYFNKSPEFVIEIFSDIINDKNPERIADDIADRLPGILIALEIQLTSENTEKCINRYILNSIGDIIRFLGTSRISQHCFNIIAVLNSAVKNPKIQGVKDMCIKIWVTLIKVCDVKSIGEILSTIFVSLENFIDEYPEEVTSILSYLIDENSSLLSRSLSDLFFIEKTKFNSAIKQSVTCRMQAQKMKDFATFKSSLETLIRHLKNENSDVRIKIYSLQYLKELLTENREELNILINSQLTMDKIIEELLVILMSNCKNGNRKLQVALAECIGELGAIEPNLRQQNYSSERNIPTGVLSQEFAVEAMKVLCQSYQQKNDSKFVITVQLGIQKLLQQHNVTQRNLNNPVWLTIPTQMRPRLLNLLDTKYKPKDKFITHEGVLFWNLAKTFDDWINYFATFLTNKITDHEVRSMLEHLLPSMKSNHYTTSLFLPYIVLHSVEEKINVVTLNDEFQFVFDVVMGTNKDLKDEQSDEDYLCVKQYDYEPKFDANNFENNMKPLGIKVAKLVFEVLDFLEHYHQTVDNASLKCDNIKALLALFNLGTLAKVNFECEEYARAMIYMERWIDELEEKEADENTIQESLKFLARIYAKLDNVDAVIGVLTMKTSEWPLIERINVNNITGNFQDSLACCKRIVEMNDVDDIESVQDIVNCYVSLDEPGTALMMYDQLIKSVENQQSKTCAEIRAEPLWRLSRFDELGCLLEDEKIASSASWGVQCNRLLLNFRDHESNVFPYVVQNVRETLMKNLKITGSEHTAYEKNYRNIINLHLICDLEKSDKVLKMLEQSEQTEENAIELLEDLIKERNTRMTIIQKNPQIEEPILCFYRIVLDLIRERVRQIIPEVPLLSFNRLINNEIGLLWNQSIRIAASNKMYQQAQSYILNAESYDTGELFILKSKLNWIQGDQHIAIRTLDFGIENLFKKGFKNDRNSSTDDKRIYAKAKLMTARYNSDAMNFDVKTCEKLFMEAKVEGMENEKLFLLTAEYLDRHYSISNESETAETGIEQVGKPEQMLLVMRNYYSSLRYGSKYIYQSMPRFLSVWLDTTASSETTSSHRLNIGHMNKLAEESEKMFNSTYFYTALSQILSRICHPSAEVYRIIKKIVTKLVENHTQQVLWLLLPMLKSNVASRKAKAKDILAKISSQQTIIYEMNQLIGHFIILATTDANRKAKKQYLREIASPLLKFLALHRNKFILPFEFNLQLNHVGSNFKFNESVVYIHNMIDEVEIMASLQRPKKVIITGSDGKQYPSLFKTQDDLRIDLRFMEVSSVLKGLLLRDPESRQRQLTTRTYSVIPISEKAGIIEWVPNLNPYKRIIYSEYEHMNHSLPHHSILENIANMQKKDQIIEFHKHVENSFPSVFANYYRKQFPTPQNYYKARMAFIKSTAAWSVIGYILGLGDRHGENILIDVCTGETFHVDCNMLFNRGETLNIPEVVPFRMTHNMIDAMGVLGVEGPFRKSCEIILRVLQKEKNTLLAYLRPMIYDIAGQNFTNEKGEILEKKAVKDYRNVKSRLMGVATKYKGTSGIPLSVEGHVSFIIKEAIDEGNLAGMFRGWMPWM